MGREVLADGHKPTQLPALLISRLWFNSRMPPAREVLAHRHHPGAIPGSRTNLLTGCASARCRVSKTQLTPGGTEAACQFHSGVVADKQCSCPASKLMWEHYPPTPPFHCGENEIQASLISSASAGATPAPATNLREVIRLPDCKSGVRKTKSEVTDWSITSASHHFGLVAQSAERPVVCGRVEGATPFGSANFRILPRDRFQG